MVLRQKALLEADQAFDQSLSDLSQLVCIPSVSAQGFEPNELRKSAEAVAQLFKLRGLENVQILHIDHAHPYIYADWLHAGPQAPTVLLYAHHDVQPPGRAEVWKTSPFDPVVRSGPGGDRLYGRGAADDKAGIIIHSASIAAILRASGRLPVNVKIVIEGEEEIGSDHLSDFLKKYRSKLDADLMVLTDLSNYDSGVPALTTSLRGISVFEIEVSALSKTVHSGMWGGPIPDPVIGLSQILASMINSKGDIAVKGLTRGFVPPNPKEASLFQKQFNEKKFREQVGLLPGVELFKTKVSPEVKTWRYPSLTANAIQASTRQGAGNIINDSAWARVSVRLARGMKPAWVEAALKAHVKKFVPWGLRATLEEKASAPPWHMDPLSKSNNKVFGIALKSLEKGYGKKPVVTGCGGSIPFVEPFSKALGGVPALLVGIEDPYTNAHGENESLLMSDLKKAIDSQIHLFFDLVEAI